MLFIERLCVPARAFIAARVRESFGRRGVRGYALMNFREQACNEEIGGVERAVFGED